MQRGGFSGKNSITAPREVMLFAMLELAQSGKKRQTAEAKSLPIYLFIAGIFVFLNV